MPAETGKDQKRKEKKEESELEIKKDTIARTVVLAAALCNQLLISCGKEALPWTENEIYIGVSTAITAAAAAWAWWKNNSFTKNARDADKYLAWLRKGGE